MQDYDISASNEQTKRVLLQYNITHAHTDTHKPTNTEENRLAKNKK